MTSMPRFSDDSRSREREAREDSEPKDWLDKHVRFIEDFTKEGRHIKEDIFNRKNFQESVQGQ